MMFALLLEMSAAGVAEKTRAKAKHRRSLPTSRSSAIFILPGKELADQLPQVSYFTRMVMKLRFITKFA